MPNFRALSEYEVENQFIGRLVTEVKNYQI